LLWSKLATRVERLLTARVPAASGKLGGDGWLHGARSLNRGRFAVTGETLEVVTDPNSGGFSTFLPLSCSGMPEGPARLSCRLEVVDGAVGVSAVTPGCTILAERIVHKPGYYQVEILVPQARDAAGILVRNAAVTGRPSRAKVHSISAERCSIESLPRIRTPLSSRVLSVRVSYCHRDDTLAAKPVLASKLMALDTGTTLAIVIDAWDELDHRIARNISDKLAPTLMALRRAGMNVVHCAHDREIHPLAAPLEGETTVSGEVMDADFIADMFRNAGVKHLLYLGYYSNMCVLTRSAGMIEMQKRGFSTILVRDASAASESPESIADEWFHRAAVHLIELNGGKTTTSVDIKGAVDAAVGELSLSVDDSSA
jgi:nicotinamidase-related amidase